MSECNQLKHVCAEMIVSFCLDGLAVTLGPYFLRIKSEHRIWESLCHVRRQRTPNIWSFTWRQRSVALTALIFGRQDSRRRWTVRRRSRRDGAWSRVRPPICSCLPMSAGNGCPKREVYRICNNGKRRARDERKRVAEANCCSHFSGEKMSFHRYPSRRKRARRSQARNQGAWCVG
jgi:hypothetical protein